MAVAPAPATGGINLGFLSVFQEAGGYLGGYLVTNAWGRPLEFRLSSAVQPNRVQHILYGDTLPGYLCGELIGKTLIDKTATPAACVLTDNPLALDLRLRLDIPVALWSADAAPPGIPIRPHLACHPRFPDDAALLQPILDKIVPLDPGEPFQRIREALNEARKLGVTARPAA